MGFDSKGFCAVVTMVGVIVMLLSSIFPLYVEGGPVPFLMAGE